MIKSPKLYRATYVLFIALLIFPVSLYSQSVNLTSFSIKKTAPGNVQIDWETASEMNNADFRILVSLDGSIFKYATRVASKAEHGNSSNPLKYQIEIKNVFENILAGIGLLGLLLILQQGTGHKDYSAYLFVCCSFYPAKKVANKRKT